MSLGTRCALTQNALYACYEIKPPLNFVLKIKKANTNKVCQKKSLGPVVSIRVSIVCLERYA